MDAQQAELRTLDYRGLFPWVHLFRAFRIAVDIRKILLAVVALGALSLGNRGIRSLPFAPEPPDPRLGFRHQPYNPEIPWYVHEIRLPSVEELQKTPLPAIASIGENWRVVLSPYYTVVEPATVLFQRKTTWPEIADAWTRLLWLLIVWAVFGGAITRMVSVEFARETKIGILSALRFSTSRFFSYLSAPLLSFVGIWLLWLVCRVGGLIGHIPQVGDVVVGALWFIPLLLGFVMALILIGLAAGWPLMYAGISTEGSDAFDGFSRAYSFVFSRPWQYLFNILVATGYGVIVVSFVAAVGSLLVYLSVWAVGSGMGGETVHVLTGGLGFPISVRSPFNNGLIPVSELAMSFASFWLMLLSLAVFGFVYSYFWTSMTIVYFLLRKADDATELDEVYLPDDETEDDLLPLVGVAASEQEVIERPLSSDGKPPGRGVETDVHQRDGDEPE